MTFKEAMEHYTAGTATEEERQLVERELEKSRLINEYLDAQWDDMPDIPTPTQEEMKQVRRRMRRRSTLIVLTSLVLAAALLLGVVHVAIPAAERLYWDPTITSYGTPFATDLELTIAAYAELFCPEVNIAGVTEHRTGFASYDISVQYWDAYRGGESLFALGSLKKGQLSLPDGLLRHCPVNIFDRATYPFYDPLETHWQRTYEKLAELPDYVRVVAAVSFPEDKSIEELLSFQDSLIEGQIGWTGIRNAPVEEQLLPLCGMDLFQSGSVRTQVNDYYPCLDSKSVESTPANLEAHFLSLLRYSEDQVQRGTGIEEQYTIHQSYYAQVLEYVQENGVYAYGCYISATPETLLALMDSNAVTQVWLQDIWISI